MTDLQLQINRRLAQIDALKLIKKYEHHTIESLLLDFRKELAALQKRQAIKSQEERRFLTERLESIEGDPLPVIINFL